MDTALGPLRFVRPIAMASLIAFGMFWALHFMISGKHHVDMSQSLNTVDFVRLKRDQMIETIQRKKPEKPPPPKTPPPPQMKVTSDVKPDTTPLPISIPNLSLAPGNFGGVYLGPFTPADQITGDAELIPLVRISPQYPPKALRDGVEGEVTLRVTIGPDGTVKSASVESSRPRGFFEASAMAAAYKSRFRPKVVDGKPVESTGTWKVTFNLPKE
jgi:periplasmic protein TonB